MKKFVPRMICLMAFFKPDENNPQERLEFVRDFLSEQVGKPIHLKIRVLPVEILDYEVAAPSKDAKQP